MIDLNKFNNFLKSKEVYVENIELYDKLLRRITDKSIDEWLITRFANGELIADGNPIYSALIKEERIAIRIIQIKNNINKPLFNVWITDNPYETEGIQELSISLQLREDTYEDLSYLLEVFVKKALSNQIITYLNNKYHRIWNEKILLYTIKKRRNHKKIIDVLSDTTSDNNITVKLLKNYASSLKDYFPILLIDYKFHNTELNSSIKQLKSATENLYNMLSVAYGSHRKNDSIHKLIHSSQYKKQLNKNKDKVKEELNEIEQIIC